MGEPPARSTPVVFHGNFVSYDQIVDEIKDVDMAAYILQRERRPWALSRYVIGRSLLQYGVDGAAHAATGRVDPVRVAYYLSGASLSLRNCNGEELDSGKAFRFGPGSEFAINTRRAGDWIAVMVEPDEVARATAAITGMETPHPKYSTAPATASPSRVARFRALLFEAMSALAEAGPSGLMPQAEARLAQTIAWEAAHLLVDGRQAGKLGRPRMDRSRLLLKLESVLAARESEPVYVTELCEAMGLPERTLRHLFDEQFGASPVKVLRCRRLCQVREALMAAPRETRISDVAGRYGFWHMGQFAADYRKLFGSRPSDTLKEPSPFRLSAQPSLAGPGETSMSRLGSADPAS